MELYMEQEKLEKLGANLKVIGIGGAGGNAVNSMIETSELGSIECIVANTDAQALQKSACNNKVQLGKKVTKGLGAGSNPDVGRRAAEEDIEEITEYITNTDILFLTAGLGGGTGSGGLPVIADVARNMGALTVAIVTKPFLFEGKRRARHAVEAIEALKKSVDTLIVVPNQKLLELADPRISMLDAFALSNSILQQAIKGISDIITSPGHINVDFADVRSVMKDMGMALMGTGRAEGQDRARQAAHKAISSQLLEDVNIQGARGVLINITGNIDLGLHEIHEAASVIYDMVSQDANIILGSVIDPEIGNNIMVTVIATGFEKVDTVDIDKEKQQDSDVVIAQKYVAKEDAAKQSNKNSTQTQMSAEQIVSKPQQSKVRVMRKEIHARTELEDTLDLDDLDTPAFLRKAARKKQFNKY